MAESWKTIVITGVAGGLLGLGYVVIAPAKYQATANIQVTKAASIDVEAPAVLVEKLKMPMYYSEKTIAACNVMDKLEPGKEIAKKIKPTLIKNTPFITISYREDSPEIAKKCLVNVLDDIRDNQGLLAKPILESKTNQLLNMKLKLELAEKIVKTFSNKNISFDFSDSKFSASALLFATIASKKSEIKDLQIVIRDLEIELLEPNTKEAFLVTPINAPQQKVSPKLAIIVLVGLMAGLFIGLLLMMGKRAYGAYVASNQ